MHLLRLSQARSAFLALAGSISLLLLTGCNLTVTNLTPDILRENPSQLYTISVRVKPTARNLDRSSILVSVVIDGKDQAMHKSAQIPDVYEYDHPLPQGRDEAAYYFLVRYRFNNDTPDQTLQVYSEVQHLKVVRRYALPMEANRGPVGARVNIVGGGFTPQDGVYLDATAARTIYESPSSISFFVPPVAPGQNYNIAVGSGGSTTLSVGVFRVDPTGVTIAPAVVAIRQGQQQSLTFTLPTPAPKGGLLLDITTDIPESVIMPEVVVPEGATTVTITVQGGKAGAGALYLKGFGQGDLTVPVSVSAQ